VESYNWERGRLVRLERESAKQALQLISTLNLIESFVSRCPRSMRTSRPRSQSLADNFFALRYSLEIE